jgi:hypothetical protein
MTLGNIGDWLLHFSGGALLAVAVYVAAGWPFVLASVPVSMAFGLLREAWQRRGSAKRFSRHAWSEGLAWPVGALCACAFYGL